LRLSNRPGSSAPRSVAGSGGSLRSTEEFIIASERAVSGLVLVLVVQQFQLPSGPSRACAVRPRRP
jgi:hypothetical protein